MAWNERCASIFRLKYAHKAGWLVYTDWCGCVRTRRNTSGGFELRGEHLLCFSSHTQQWFALYSNDMEVTTQIKEGNRWLGRQPPHNATQGDPGPRSEDRCLGGPRPLRPEKVGAKSQEQKKDATAQFSSSRKQVYEACVLRADGVGACLSWSYIVIGYSTFVVALQMVVP